MGKEQKENVNKELYREIFLPWILERDITERLKKLIEKYGAKQLEQIIHESEYMEYWPSVEDEYFGKSGMTGRKTK